MDLYTLDDNFLKNEVVDEYASLIWTERYNASGDFVIVIPKNSPYLPLLEEGVFISIDESVDVGIIKTKSYEDGKWTIVGTFLTDFLKERLLRNTWSTAKDHWSLTGAPGSVAWTIVDEMCGPSGLVATNAVVPNGSREVLPNLIAGSLASGSSMTIAVQYGNVYDGVKAVCDIDNLGFRLYPQQKIGGYDLLFTTYAGKDRTTSQSINSVVIFEPAMDTFTNIKQVKSIDGYKTVAYAWANGMTAQSQIGIATVSGSPLSGWGRRTLLVNASDVNAADYSSSALTSILNQRAKDALINNNYVKMTDGELVPQNEFQYGDAYNLGDIIELRDETETVQKARVTEYIRAQDNTGFKAYPTLSVI